MSGQAGRLRHRATGMSLSANAEFPRAAGPQGPHLSPALASFQCRASERCKEHPGGSEQGSVEAT